MFESVWMNDHLTDIGLDRAGPSWEALTAMAALDPPRPGQVGRPCRAVRDVPAPERHRQGRDRDGPRTGGRFILGLGAGWFEPEHTPFGIPFAADAGAVRPLRIGGRTSSARMFSDAAATDAGVTRPDPFYPLDGATNDPPPR